MDPLNRLTRLIADEENPHELITQVAADAELMQLVRSFKGTGGATPLASDNKLAQACRTSRIAVNYFWDRLSLISRILNLRPAGEDYYDVLGVGRDASPEQIKRAFRRLSLAYHPDVNPHNPDASHQFQRVHQAYETLGDPKLRRLYDQTHTQTEWVEPPSFEEPVKGPRTSKRRKYALALSGLLTLLLTLIFFVDYQSWQTKKYYKTRLKARSKSAARAPKPTDGAAPPKESKTVHNRLPASLNNAGAAGPPYVSSAGEIEDGGLVANADLDTESQAGALDPPW